MKPKKTEVVVKPDEPGGAFSTALSAHEILKQRWTEFYGLHVSVALLSHYDATGLPPARLCFRRGGALGHLAAAAFHCGVCKHARGAHDVHRSAEYNHTNDMSDFQLDRSGISEIQHEYDTN